MSGVSQRASMLLRASLVVRPMLCCCMVSRSSSPSGPRRRSDATWSEPLKPRPASTLMVNPPLKPEPPLKPWGGRTCPSAPGPPARSVHVTRLTLARRSETTTKRARDEVPSRNLRISSLPAKVVLRWVMVASSAKNESAASTSWRLRAISKAAITEAGSAVACAVAMVVVLAKFS